MKKLVLACLLLAACSKDTGTGALDLGSDGSSQGTAQLPPTGAAAIDAWLAGGAYKAWHCESAVHDARDPSPHGKNRICSNDVLSSHGAGAFPADAAGVKEIYDSAGTQIAGYAVYRHITAGATGDTWYWYEKLNGSVFADGSGGSGTPKDSCVACHSAAGTANNSGHDFVYTQVK